MQCEIFVFANVGGRYGRRTIEEREALGFEQASEPDVYGAVRMKIRQRCPGCTCKSREECMVLQDLGTLCDTNG